MNIYLIYVILAVIQGLAEILPISSSAHLAIFSNILGIDSSDLTLSIFLHFGSALAVIIFYRKRLYELLRGFFKYFKHKENNKEEFKETTAIVIASVPAALAGLLLEDLIEKHLINYFFIGLFLVITAFLLILTKVLKKGERNFQSLKPRDSLLVGLFQMIGILPGISRSGITYVGSKVTGISSEKASEMVFLMFLPVSLGSGLLKSVELVSNPAKISIGPLLVALLVVTVLTFISLKLFLVLIKKDRLYYFSYYLIPLGLFIMTKGLYC